MSLCMPELDPKVIARRGEIARALRRIVGEDAVIDHPDGLAAYESDGLAAYRQPPLLVALPATTAEVSAVLAWCHAQAVRVVPRGAGTSLSGGALPLGDAVVLRLARLRAILDIDWRNLCVTAQPGVINLAITHAVQHAGSYYAPDPSSQIACTIGGNVAENSGGVHCLKYGLTTHNVIGVEFVLMDGTVMSVGGKTLDDEGLDLLSVIVGSEGLLGVATAVTVRILPKPEHARALLVGFETVRGAGDCVGAIIGAGIVPAGMEMMDRLAIEAAEAFVGVGYPLDVEALLIIDGAQSECDHQIAQVRQIVERHARVISASPPAKPSVWRSGVGRKAAYPAVGRISPDYYCMDGTIPRRRIGDVLDRIGALSAEYGLRVANVFHAGDGNLHPLILYDANTPGVRAH